MRSALGLGLLTACGFSATPAGITPGDGSADAPSDAFTFPSGPWGDGTAITVLNTAMGEDDPSLTADMLEIWFGSKRSGGVEDIYHATRTATDQAWSAPAAVAELNSGSSETTAKVSADGLAITFSSNRGGDFDLYYSTRGSRSATWSTPVRVAELSMTGVGDYGAYLSPDLLHVMFCRGANVADEALYTSQRASATATWDAPVVVAELNDGTHSECDPMLPSQRVLFYSSNLTGDYDVYVATRATGAWSVGQRQTGIDVAAFDDRDPWVSQDGHTMFYSSTRYDGIERLYVSQR